ncbi:hypothetical protein PTMSG1_05029 [Pyrenophora teres f. maculata]|nr:hypothetical protein PTMSG1_05029 [Pyrenophora teres f. maculata]
MPGDDDAPPWGDVNPMRPERSQLLEEVFNTANTLEKGSESLNAASQKWTKLLKPSKDHRGLVNACLDFPTDDPATVSNKQPELEEASALEKLRTRVADYRSRAKRMRTEREKAQIKTDQAAQTDEQMPQSTTDQAAQTDEQMPRSTTDQAAQTDEQMPRSTTDQAAQNDEQMLRSTTDQAAQTDEHSLRRPSQEGEHGLDKPNPIGPSPIFPQSLSLNDSKREGLFSLQNTPKRQNMDTGVMHSSSQTVGFNQHDEPRSISGSRVAQESANVHPFIGPARRDAHRDEDYQSRHVDGRATQPSSPSVFPGTPRSTFMAPRTQPFAGLYGPFANRNDEPFRRQAVMETNLPSPLYAQGYDTRRTQMPPPFDFYQPTQIPSPAGESIPDAPWANVWKLWLDIWLSMKTDLIGHRNEPPPLLWRMACRLMQRQVDHARYLCNRSIRTNEDS